MASTPERGVGKEILSWTQMMGWITGCESPHRSAPTTGPLLPPEFARFGRKIRMEISHGFFVYFCSRATAQQEMV